MSAEILPFRPKIIEICPYGDFRKALLAVRILSDFSVQEAVQIIAFWVARGLMTEDDAVALCAFYDEK